MPTVSAEDYKLLILPDNIVTQDVALDSYIYDAAAEFFADGVSSLINTTDNIKSKSVSEVRSALKANPSAVLTAKDLTNKFRTTYNVDYNAIQKLAKITGNRYVLLITSTLDAENYILRRTFWDFLNIPGATVVDPAYKINTYAVLVDSQTNTKLWSDTYYKTISVVENRIITRGPSPQVEQLGKIKDYSNYVCPQIAREVQVHILPPYILSRESTVINYDMGNIDNVFTKKYRSYGKNTKRVYNEKKASRAARKARRQEEKALKEQLKAEQQAAELQVEAKQVYENEDSLNKINSTVKNTQESTKPAVYKSEDVDPYLFDSIDIRKPKKNNLFGEYNSDRPCLRDYAR